MLNSYKFDICPNSIVKHYTSKTNDEEMENVRIMPKGDRTGPRGSGSKTGRAQGYCSGNQAPGYAASGSEGSDPQGNGKGRGKGRGRATKNRRS